MKIAFKKNEEKAKLDNEIKQKLDYMTKIGPGEEYQNCLEELKQLYDLKKRMSLTYKLKEAFPWISLGVTAVGTIGVPLFLGVLAWSKSENGELKEGDAWRQAVSNVMKPQNPQSQTENKA